MVVVVTAYGEDNLYQKKHQDVVGIYTSVSNAIRGAMKDGMTNSQREYLNRINAFWLLELAVIKRKGGECFQVNFEYETDKRKKPCSSSYMFQTCNLD